MKVTAAFAGRKLFWLGLGLAILYVWFQEDFGGTADRLMEHWQDYADPPLADALANYNGGLAHDYDWRLNGIDAKP